MRFLKTISNGEVCEERKEREELEKYHNKSEYELAVLKKEAAEDGKVLIKKEYVDENGDTHIVIGKDEKRNKNVEIGRASCRERV